MSEVERGGTGTFEGEGVSTAWPVDSRGAFQPTERNRSERLRGTLGNIARRDVATRRLRERDSPFLGRLDAKLDRLATAAEIAELQLLVIHSSSAECADFVETLMNQGASVSSIYLGLLAPVARELGLGWDRDEIDFVDVSIAVGRLEVLVQRIGDAPGSPNPYGSERRVVLAKAQDNQHGLGILMVSELFRQKGWDVAGGPDLEIGEELLSIVHDTRFGLVALSAGTERQALQFTEQIAAIRRASLNTAIAVLVGGPGFNAHPEISVSVGADGLATDAEDAVSKGETLVDR